jgi:hypothetical protein
MSKNKYEYIDKIIKNFQESYFLFHGFEYEIITLGKERNMAGKILKLYKQKYPDSKSEETLEGLKKYFDICISINDNWLRQNMSLSIIVNKFNQINNILRNGKASKKGATNRQITESILHNFKERR